MIASGVITSAGDDVDLNLVIGVVSGTVIVLFITITVILLSICIIVNRVMKVLLVTNYVQSTTCMPKGKENVSYPLCTVTSCPSLYIWEGYMCTSRSGLKLVTYIRAPIASCELKLYFYDTQVTTQFQDVQNNMVPLDNIRNDASLLNELHLAVEARDSVLLRTRLDNCPSMVVDSWDSVVCSYS